MTIRLAAFAFASIVLVVNAAEPPSFTKEQVEFYEKDVKAVLEQHCLKCHGAEPKIKGELNLTTRGSVLAGA